MGCFRLSEGGVIWAKGEGATRTRSGRWSSLVSGPTIGGAGDIGEGLARVVVVLATVAEVEAFEQLVEKDEAGSEDIQVGTEMELVASKSPVRDGGPPELAV